MPPTQQPPRPGTAFGPQPQGQHGYFDGLYDGPQRAMPVDPRFQSRAGVSSGFPQTATSTQAYRSFTLRKIPLSSLGPGESPSWRRATKTETYLPVEELVKQLKKSKGKKSIKDQLSALRSDNERIQIERLVDEQNQREMNSGVKWHLVSIDEEVRNAPKIGRSATEVSAVHVILKRHSHPDLDERLKGMSIQQPRRQEQSTWQNQGRGMAPPGPPPPPPPPPPEPFHNPHGPPPIPLNNINNNTRSPGPLGPLFNQGHPMMGPPPEFNPTTRQPGPPGPPPNQGAGPQIPPPPPMPGVGPPPFNPSMRYPGPQFQPNQFPNQNGPVPPKMVQQPHGFVEETGCSDDDSDASSIIQVIEEPSRKSKKYAKTAKIIKEKTRTNEGQMPPPPPAMGDFVKKPHREQLYPDVERKPTSKNTPRAVTPPIWTKRDIQLSDDSSDDDKRWRDSDRSSYGGSNPKHTPPSTPGSMTPELDYRRGNLYKSRRDDRVRQDSICPKRGSDRRYSDSRFDVIPGVSYRFTGVPIESRGSHRNHEPTVHQRPLSYDNYPANPAGRRYPTSPQYLPPLPDPEADLRYDRVRRQNEERVEHILRQERAAADRRDRQRRDRRLEQAYLNERARERLEREQLRSTSRDYVDGYPRHGYKY